MSKRFTDSNKWKNQWFRELPLQAKLTWIYLCDECEMHGVIKLDYGLASFQLDFSLKKEHLIKWFGDKIHFIDDEKILIIQFFELQYGDSKDSWNAKLQAKKKLEALGFIIENNKVIIHKVDSPPTVEDCPKTFLSKGIGIVKGNNNIKEDEIFNFDDAYKTYIVQIKGPKAEKRFKEQIKTKKDFDDLVRAIANYKIFLKRENWRKPKQAFDTFLGSESSGYFWREFIDYKSHAPIAPPPKPKEPEVPFDYNDEARKSAIENSGLAKILKIKEVPK